MRFQIGDVVVHPLHGAGIITGFKKLQPQGNIRRYYEIKLLRRNETNLMIPVQECEDIGMRPAISTNRLGEVWDTFRQSPNSLPDNHRSRYKLLKDKMQTGDIYQIAEAVRDIAWRRQQRDGLTQKSKEIFKQALRLLAGEIAAAKQIELETAQEQVQERLRAAIPQPESA